MEKITEKPRIKALDSLRGFAAITVVTTHILGVTKHEVIFHLTPFYLFKAGHEAVIFFFILSGFVLVYQYSKNPDYNYKNFLIQRIFRIYLPYIVSVILAITLLLICNPKHTGTAWIHNLWVTKISVKLLIKHLILVGDFKTNAFNNVIWSLVHEMRLAIIFPLFLLIVKLRPVRAMIIVITVSIIGIISIYLNFEPHYGFNNGYSFTCYYLYVFTIGGLIAYNRNAIINKYQKLKNYQKIVALLAALLIYNYSGLSYMLLGNERFSMPFKEVFSMVTADLLTAFASVYFVVAAVGSTGKTWLTREIPQFLGKISYSLYLVHLPVIGFIYFELYTKIPTALILGLGFITSLLMAVVFNRYVEQLSVKIFKNINNKMNRYLSATV